LKKYPLSAESQRCLMVELRIHSIPVPDEVSEALSIKAYYIKNILLAKPAALLVIGLL